MADRYRLIYAYMAFAAECGLLQFLSLDSDKSDIRVASQGFAAVSAGRVGKEVGVLSNYSDNREMEMEIKYLRKVLADVDSNIVLPDSLKAEAMRRKLDAIPEPKKISFLNAEFLRSRVFSLQSVVSYAVAFVIIFAAAWFMRLGSPDIVDGNIDTVDAGSAENAVMDAEPFAMRVQEAEDNAADAAGVQEQEQADIPGILPPPESLFQDSMGVGGGGAAKQLAADDRYTYLYRENDLTDPDGAGYTLEIVDEQNQELAARIGLEGFVEIRDCFVSEDMLTLVGLCEGGVVSRSWSLAGLETESGPVQTAELIQPGSYVAARAFEGVLHTVTLSDQAPEGVEPDVLEGSASEAVCILTALDIVTGQAEWAAWQGADNEINLYNRNLYISWVVPQGEEDEELHMAQIILTGLDMEFVMVP